MAQPWVNYLASDKHTLFDSLVSKPPSERVDFVMILNSETDPDRSCFLTHWDYGRTQNSGGPVRFVSAQTVADERPARDNQSPMGCLSTLACTTNSLLWFYLFLTNQLRRMQLPEPDLYAYISGEARTTLGWQADESQGG